MKPRLYITKSKKIIRKTVELELEERQYFGGGVGLRLSFKGADSSQEDVPGNNNLGIENVEEPLNECERDLIELKAEHPEFFKKRKRT